MRIFAPCLIMLGTLVLPGMGLAGEFDGFFTDGKFIESFDYGQECGMDPGPNPVKCQDLIAPHKPAHYNWNQLGSGGDTEALVAANNPNGDGGNGARHWVGDGKNNNAARIIIRLPQQEPELWIRWYMRYELGFAWSQGNNPGYDKFLYMWSSGPGGGSGFAMIPGHTSRIGTTIASWDSGGKELRTGKTWDNIFGSDTGLGDGKFHLQEVYIKVSSAMGASDGIVRYWIDGELEAEATNVNFTEGSTNPSDALGGLKRIEFHSNQNGPANGGDAYVDYDDIAIYTVTPPNTDSNGNPWIGPLNGSLGGGGSPPPIQPNSPAPVGVSFYDPIEDNNLTSRGRYDNTSMVLANSEATSGSTKSIEYRFNSGATQAAR